MTSLRCLIVVGLFGLAPVLCGHRKNGVGLTCSERCQNRYGYIDGEGGSRIFITVGAINDNGGQEVCECRVSDALQFLVESRELDDARYKWLLAQTPKNVVSWLKTSLGVQVHSLGAEEQKKSPNTGPVSSGNEKNPEHVLSEEKCKDKCRKEAGYRFAETKDKVVRAWITEGYYNHALFGPKQCECKSSKVLINYLRLKGINTHEFELLRVRRKWEKINEWLKKQDLSLIVFGKEGTGGDPVENETSCTEKCRKSHGYIDGETGGSIIFLMIGVLNNDKFIMVHGEKQRDLVDCECRINPILEELLISKRLNFTEFKGKNDEYEADKWLLEHMGRQVHFLEPKKSSKKGLFGIKLKVTKEECEEQCFEKEGYVELGPRLHLKVAKGHVVVSCMRSKCECKINEGLIAYLEKNERNPQRFRFAYEQGDAEKWLRNVNINIKFPVSSRNRKKQPTFPFEQRQQHPPPPAEQEHESEQCRLSPSTEPLSHEACTLRCQNSYGYITGGGSGSKIYVSTGIIVTKDTVNKKGKKTVCDCRPNKELEPILKKKVNETVKAAWMNNVQDVVEVLHKHKVEVHYKQSESEAKSKKSSQRQESLKATPK